MMNRVFFIISFCLSISMLVPSLSVAELVLVDDEALNEISGQSGITLNAKIILGDETNFVFANTSGKTQADASADETGYLIVNEIQGTLEIKGLALDLISDLNNSGKAAFQWTLPKTIKATNFKTTGIYASGTETVDPAGIESSFLLGLEFNGELSLPANTQISVFVVN
ncbi:MAG: hypothetical protein JKX82_15115 [Oleispira sp.]|nr:hypothetical protein [Oleispira sp.]